MTELRRAISAQLGRDDFAAVDAPRVSVRIRRTSSDALVADVTLATLDTAPTTRTIDGGSGTCTELVRAAALSIALAIEAEASAPGPAPAPAPAPPPVPARATATAPAQGPSPALGAEGQGTGAPRDMRGARALLLASGMTQLGLLPSASLGGAGNVRVRVADHVWLSARGFFLPEARMPNDAFGMTLASGGGGACVEPLGSASVSAVGCAHVLAGSLAVVSASVPMGNGGAKAFGAAALSAGARARVAGPLVLEGAIEATVPFGHPTFLTATCPPSGFQQPFAAVALVFGAGVSIP